MSHVRGHVLYREKVMLKKEVRQIQQVGHQQIGRVRHDAPCGVVDILKTGSPPPSDVLSGHKNHTRSETLASMFRRGAMRFHAEIRKHPVFCGHLRIT
ncbi:MAG: hypothetical protein UU88_C0015G0006 [Parcubacteria group bacterium GW2011_GWC1_42_11]|uniref:Uncharacterized protein n=1 Tax=Candidatus Nomurabacteria bacterium GW2011_GWC2_42_20 TaxID=1618756 RepID=A0A0G1BPH1_9BACT|nr:MAG: hypothetical protein UU88_C0015G0006 [Parcubacteria group bacterium GW2011_GWC1_42_11]KKS48161.1 MAG: hypothetical protein UV12_C0002G0010 [Candidatus Nomurabacteria bacterium GW2011_GWC2_42_20]KKT07977.1 MAG: hypothetical protein UV86_C0025G0010 [Candidatus Nomurabacteria bacterium GW2011_GWB1_43_20]